MNSICVFLFLSVLSGPTFFAEAKSKPPVHAAIPSGLPRPLLFEDEPKLTGMAVDYTQALLDELKQTTEIALLPHNRVLNSVKTGRMDFSCYSNREWFDSPDTLLWSEPLFIKREVILGPAPMPKNIKDLKGRVIGTMLGYTYPVLDPYFKSKQLIREDGVSEDSNFKKFESKHIRYIVIDEIFLDYGKKQYPDLEKGNERLFVQEYPVSCAVSKVGRVDLASVNKAIAKLKSSGQLEAIFKKYGLHLRAN